LPRTLNIGLYSEFFGAAIGGGEKYLGVTAEAIRKRWPAHRLELITKVPADRSQYERELNLDLSGVEMRMVDNRATVMQRLGAYLARPLPLYRNLVLGAPASRSTRPYDLVLAMVYVHSVLSGARRTVVLCQFPYLHSPVKLNSERLVKRLYHRPYNRLRAALLGTEAAEADKVICQSEYVAGHVREMWEVEPAVVHPPIDIPANEPDWALKRPIILSVGRFFAVGHNKRHALMINVFKKLCDEGLTGWELHLAGSVHRDPFNAGYFERMQTLTAGYPIHLHGDAPYADLQDLYRRASIYWHAAGHGVNVETNPADVEHFGMSTAEAMANGAVPVVIRVGGQVEVVEDGRDGFLWATIDELKARTLQVASDSALRQRLACAARERSKHFSRERFERAMVEQLEPIVRELESS
jgi:glycosyltransferase involved in cell wall biosynthesis